MFRTSIRLLALSLALIASASFAQTYPNRTVRVIIGFGAGGSTDFVARLFAEEIGKRLGQQFVVENRTGAGGTVAAYAVKNSTPDGYTLFGGSATPFSSVFLKDNPLDVGKGDLLPVVNHVFGENIIMVRSSLAGSLKEVGDKAKGTRLKHGGIGPTTHMLMALVAKQFNWDFENIPFKATDQAVTAMLSGDIDLVQSSLPGWTPHIDAGKVRVIAVLSPNRSPLLPNVPTVRELGGTVDLRFTLGLWAPPGTPRDVIARLNAAGNEAVKVPAVAEKLRPFALIPSAGTPEDQLRGWENEIRVYREAAPLINYQPQ